MDVDAAFLLDEILTHGCSQDLLDWLLSCTAVESDVEIKSSVRLECNLDHLFGEGVDNTILEIKLETAVNNLIDSIILLITGILHILLLEIEININIGLAFIKHTQLQSFVEPNSNSTEI